MSGNIKIKDKRLDFKLDGEVYDLRVGLAKEINVEPRGLQANDWQVARQKVKPIAFVD